MAVLPTDALAKAYLIEEGLAGSWSDAAIGSAFAAEKAAQARRCRVPAADATEWPDDLAEALYRRVAVNLALRPLPLAVQAQISEAAVATTRVGGGDPEVRRLETPYRKLVMG